MGFVRKFSKFSIFLEEKLKRVRWDALKLLSKSSFFDGVKEWRARWDLNPGFSTPEADALIRARLRAHNAKQTLTC
jgi:hypothetical protein